MKRTTTMKRVPCARHAVGCRPSRPPCHRLRNFRARCAAEGDAVPSLPGGHQPWLIGDDLLDFLEAGPKMRKWYGAPPKGVEEEERRQKRERRKQEGGDGGNGDEGDDDEGPTNSVLVIDANSKVGEQTVLQLILSRIRVKAIVSDVEASAAAFGPYVKCVKGSLDNERSLRRALKRVRAVIIAGGAGPYSGRLLMKACREVGTVKHVVLVSTYAKARWGPLAPIVDREHLALEEAAREEAIRASGIPFTIIRGGRIQPNAIGRSPSLLVARSDAADAADATPSEGPPPTFGEPEEEASVSRADLAFSCVSSLSHAPAEGGVVVSIAGSPASTQSGGATLVSEVEDWEQVYEA